MALKSSLDPDALPQLIGDFKPVDEWQAHINHVFYGLRGARLRDYYQTFAAADYRLAYALAEDYFRRLCARGSDRKAMSEAGQDSQNSKLVVMEWGCGNGNLAACFLDRLKALDVDSQFYPNIQYVLIDKSDEMLAEARKNLDLMPHKDKLLMRSGSVEDLQEFQDGTVDRIICNELWSELPTKLVLRRAGDLSEEHLRPNVSESKLAEITDWPGFVNAFDQKDSEALKQFPSFLEDLVWEREYHEIEAKDLQFRRTITDFLRGIDEEVLVPVNTGAAATIKEALRLLSADAIGFSSFDAGTSDSRVLNDPEKPCYSVHGGQFSFMVNFALLEEITSHLGAKAAIESQKEFIATSLNSNVLTLMDLLSAHPRLPSADSWEFDAHILRTITAINTVYKSPYTRVIEFPIGDDVPADGKAALEALLSGLSQKGIPDTIAYLTETEVMEAMPELEKLGYHQEDLRMMLQAPPQLVDYTHFSISRSL